MDQFESAHPAHRKPGNINALWIYGLIGHDAFEQFLRCFQGPVGRSGIIEGEFPGFFSTFNHRPIAILRALRKNHNRRKSRTVLRRDEHFRPMDQLLLIVVPAFTGTMKKQQHRIFLRPVIALRIQYPIGKCLALTQGECLFLKNLHGGIICAFVKPSILLQPVSKAFDPLIRGKSLGFHTESMTALGIHVHFHRFFSRQPGTIQGHAVRSQVQTIITRCCQKHGRSISCRLADHFIRKERINRRHECRPVFIGVSKSCGTRHRSSGRESHDADTRRIQLPFIRMRSHIADRRPSVSNAEWNDLPAF